MFWIKKGINLALYVLIPILLAYIIVLIFHFNMGLTCAALYGILILFLMPGDVFFSSSTDYQTKRMPQILSKHQSKQT